MTKLNWVAAKFFLRASPIFVIASLAAICGNAYSASRTPMPALDACNVSGFQLILTPAVSRFESRAYWLNRQLLKWPAQTGSERVGERMSSGDVYKLYYSAQGQISAVKDGKVSGADGALVLDVFAGQIPAAEAKHFKYVSDGIVLKIKQSDSARLSDLYQQQLVLVQESDVGAVRDSTALQIAGALDDVYAGAAAIDDFGVSISVATKAADVTRKTGFKLWAPTAQQVAVCTYATGSGRATSIDVMQFDAATGTWHASKTGDLSGQYYQYLVDVFVPGVGLVRNFVTDPYSISLTTDSKRSYIARLEAANLKPKGWETTATPTKVTASTDMVIYELHVRDFSINDASVSASHRGKYLAFAEPNSNGMQHLRALSRAGLTDVHLLPVFDFATVPEAGCVTPTIPGIDGDGASEAPQQVVTKTMASDCFNWGYDPQHFGAPEGSYASDAADGAKRILEFRQMVAALHRAGLRVGMDVVYNHTMAAGQNDKSVLDRIVPGYYHRLNANGVVERSTCCANTATENLMMGKLMIDTAATWAKEYKIDSFRFDLMAHQPRSAMEALQIRVSAARGRPVQIIGEGWNFGEIANGARFEQASQLSLNGSGIGTFSDRARDAIRGGGSSDSGEALIKNQGYINGLVYAPNALADPARPITDLLKVADMVRVGLAGSIRDYVMKTYTDADKTLQEIDYGGQPAGYASQPSEVVNYVENHDNQTLFDINVYRLPLHTSREDRARVQMLGAAITAFSQGVGYFHAGIDTLRSKSLDRNSFESGDWFNRLDWTYHDNYFGIGLPPKTDNGNDYALTRPLLRNSGIKPTSADIVLARDMFRDLVRIRASSSLFRLRTAADIKSRLHFQNVGTTQIPTVIVGHLDGAGYAGAGFKTLTYLINVDKTAQSLVIPAEKGRAYVLHPVHMATNAADKRPAKLASYDSASGRFVVPARSAVVFVER